MRRIVALAMAVAVVGLAVSVATGAIANPVQGSASVTKLIKKYAKKYARHYAKPGPAGPSGIATIIEVESPKVTVQPGQNSYEANGRQPLAARCPPGSHVVGTGFDGGIGNADFVKTYGSLVGGFFENDRSIPFEVSVQAICASGPGVPAKVQAKAAIAPISAYKADVRRSLALHSAKSCSAGYVHAIVPGGAHKCLRVGQFCSHRRGYARVYHRAGFYCKRNGHLGYY